MDKLNYRNLAFGKWIQSGTVITPYGDNGVKAVAKKFPKYPRVYKVASNYNLQKGKRYSITFKGKSLVEKSLAVYIANFNGVDILLNWRVDYKKYFNIFSTTFTAPIDLNPNSRIFFYVNDHDADFENTLWIEDLMVVESNTQNIAFNTPPEDYAPDGILKGTYQSDIKFTKYFPEINAEILFLTGDSIRPENKTVKAQALFTTNKEPIKNPSEFFNIEWYLDPVEAGGEVKKIGTGEFMEIPVSDLQLKGGRLVPIRLKYNFK